MADGSSKVPGTMLQHDEGIRRETSLAKLSALKPAFREDGVIHDVAFEGRGCAIEAGERGQRFGEHGR